jgi:MarR family 2-MHQ and catechol resistance regulon transcriptional repressor
MAETPGIHLWLVMMKSYRSLSRHAERSITMFDLGLSDFAVLEALLHKGPQKVNEIGRRVGLTSGSITSAIDRLETAGLVVRSSNETDRRSRLVELTARGRKEIRKVFAHHEKAMEAAVRGLSKSERSALVQLLKKLGTAADASLSAAVDKLEPPPSGS